MKTKSENGSECDTRVALPQCDTRVASPQDFDPIVSANRIRALMQAGIYCYWSAGEELTGAKEVLKGKFGKWLVDHCGINARTAQRHMRLYSAYTRDQVRALDGLSLRKMLALTEGPDGLEPAELKKMTAAELRAEVEKLMEAREIGQGQLEDLQGELDAERAENQSLHRKVKRLKGMKFDSSKHPITGELARLAYEIEKISEAASKIDPKSESDVANGIMEHIVVLNSKLGRITRMFSIATRKRA